MPTPYQDERCALSWKTNIATQSHTVKSVLTFPLQTSAGPSNRGTRSMVQQQSSGSPSTIGSKQPCVMDSIMSLGRPLKQFTSCMTGGNAGAKRGSKRSQSVRRSSFTRRRSISRRRSLPCGGQKVPDSWLRSYQAELKRERSGTFLGFVITVLLLYFSVLAASVRDRGSVFRFLRHLARQACLMRIRMSLACRLLAHVSHLM